MGASASIADQSKLFSDIQAEYEKFVIEKKREAVDNANHKEMTDEASDDDTICLCPTEPVSDVLGNGLEDLALYNKVDAIYNSYHNLQKLKENVLFTELTEIENALKKAFDTGLTPLILDSSSDDKICTFLSYQPDVVIFEARNLIFEHNKPLGQSLDSARQYLVNAMKHGKMLVIRLGTTSPDFQHKFNDDYLATLHPLKTITPSMSCKYVPPKIDRFGDIIEDEEVVGGAVEVVSDTNNDSNGVETAADKKEIKEQYINVDDCNSKATSNTAELNVEAAVNKAVSIATGGIASSTSSNIINIGSSKVTTSGKSPDNCLREAYFPSEVFIKGGQLLHSVNWIERLFREEDMKPHKNFAICRDEFRVCVTSQLPLENIEEYLFGSQMNGDGNLPDKELFKIITVVYDDEASAEEKSCVLIISHDDNSGGVETSTDLSTALSEKFIDLGHQVIEVVNSKINNNQTEYIHKGCTHLMRIHMDISTEKGREKMKHKMISEYPAINMLVYLDANIGTSEFMTCPQHPGVSNVDWDLVKETINDDMLTFIHLSTLFLPHFKSHVSHSAIVYVNNIHDFLSLAAYPIHHAIKAAMHTYLECLRHQLHSTSNTVAIEIDAPCTDTTVKDATNTHDQQTSSATVDNDIFTHSVLTQLLLGRSEITYDATQIPVECQYRY